MRFDNNRPIYLQIADLIFEYILSKKWVPEDRIPSVREIAEMMEVNPNTAVRVFGHLSDRGIIYNKRGIGYFVAKDGYQRVLNEKKKEFQSIDLPILFKKMILLDIDMEELKTGFTTFKNELNHDEN